jgi:nucleoside-diphosphate-sugar epimerase
MPSASVSLSGSRALVTGATGFIGTYVVRRLRDAGVGVRALVLDGEPDGALPPDVETVVGDIRQRPTLVRAVRGVDCVIHLAGRVHEVSEHLDTDAHEAVTERGTRNVVDVAREQGVAKFVFLSSLAVYGPCGEKQYDEDSPRNPTTAYGRAKLSAEQYVLEQQDAMHVAALQPAMVYGGGCKGNLPRMMRMVERGLFPPIPEVGNRRSLAYVEDVAEAVLLAAVNPAANGRAFIVTDGESYSGRRIYEAVCRGLGKPTSRRAIPAPVFRVAARLGDIAGNLSSRRFPFDSPACDQLLGSSSFSISRIKRELGFRPTMTLERAMPKIVNSFRAGRRTTR